jgi:hypothetical protein
LAFFYHRQDISDPVIDGDFLVVGGERNGELFPVNLLIQRKNQL